MGEPKVTKREFELTDSIEKLKGVLDYLGIKYRIQVHEYRCEDFASRLLHETMLEWGDYVSDESRYKVRDGELIGPDGTLMDLSGGDHVIFFERRIAEVLEFQGMVTDSEVVARILDYDQSDRIVKWNRLMVDHLGIGDKFEICFSDSVLERMKNIRQYGGKIENVRH